MMAPWGSRPRRSPCQNLSLIQPVKNELAKDPGPVRGPHYGNISSIPFRNPIPSSILVLILIFALASALVPTNELFK